MSRLIGLFGGTFDPVHRGHISALKVLCKEISFEQINWVLSAQPPHKDQISASIEHRFAMLKAALSDVDNYIADDTEIIRQANSPNAKSYTIDTIAEFRARYPNANICLIIGGDSLLNLPSWHRYSELVESANWIVMHRPGYELVIPPELSSRIVSSAAELLNWPAGKLFVFKQSDFDISSTELRAQLQKNNWQDSDFVQKNLTNSVITYIQQQHLYRIPAMNSEQIKDQVIEALDNIKGQDIKVIDIAEISDFADYMIVASGTSDTHVKALAREASSHLRVQGVKPLNEDGADVGEWVLVDFGDVVLHVMRPEVREYYDLEKLWDKDVRAMLEKHRASQEEPS